MTKHFSRIVLTAGALLAMPMLAMAGSVGPFSGGTNPATDVTAYFYSPLGTSNYLPVVGVTPGSFDASGLTNGGTYAIHIDFTDLSATGNISFSGNINGTSTPESASSTNLLAFDNSKYATAGELRVLFDDGSAGKIFSDIYLRTGVAENSISAVPLPPAVWAGCGLLGMLALTRKLRTCI